MNRASIPKFSFLDSLEVTQNNFSGWVVGLGGWEESEQLIMGRLRIRTSPVQLDSAKAGTELGNKSKSKS